MKKRVMLLVLVGILSTMMSYAQTVTKSANGAIIDASAIPHTKVKKARGTDGTNSTMGSNTAANIGSAVSNERVYYKFEVYKADNYTGKDWFSAVNLCKDLLVDGGGWRLPTQREFMLMWVLKPELHKIGDFVPFSNLFYRSATEREGSANSWLMNPYDGYTAPNYGKTNRYLVRCVRDL